MASQKKPLRSTMWRFAFLFLCSSSLMGFDFCYDNPAPLMSQLQKDPNCGVDDPDVDHGMGMDKFEFNLLYSVYSMPNIILPLLGGYLIDKIGKRVGIILFSTFIALGQTVFLLSTYVVCWAQNPAVGRTLMIISRGIYGLGGENLTITTSAFIGQWFKGKELAFALGIDISAARLAATVNDSTQVIMYQANERKLHFGFFVGLLVTIYSVVTALITSFFDYQADKSEENNTLVETEEEAEDEVRIADIVKFKLPYWYITFSCLFFYMGYFSFMNIVSELIQKRFAISELNAGFLMSIPYFMGALATPITGIIVDRIGKRPLVMCLSNTFMIFGFVAMILLPQNNDKHNIQTIVVLPLILCGFAYCFYASGLWPSIPYVVDKHLLGSAYGITTAVQNIGLATGPMLASLIIDAEKVDGNYRQVNMLQIAEVSVGLVFGILLWIYDSTKGGGVLSVNSVLAAKRQKEMKEQENNQSTVTN